MTIMILDMRLVIVSLDMKITLQLLFVFERNWSICVVMKTM